MKIREEDEYHAPRGDDQIMTLNEWRSIIYRLRQSQGILPNIEKWGNIYKSSSTDEVFYSYRLSFASFFLMSIINISILQHHTPGFTKIIPHEAYTR